MHKFHGTLTDEHVRTISELIHVFGQVNGPKAYRQLADLQSALEAFELVKEEEEKTNG